MGQVSSTITRKIGERNVDYDKALNQMEDFITKLDKNRERFINENLKITRTSNLLEGATQAIIIGFGDEEKDSYTNTYNVGFIINEKTEKISNLNYSSTSSASAGQSSYKYTDKLTDMKKDLIKQLKLYFYGNKDDGSNDNTQPGVILKKLVTDIYILYKFVYNKKIEKNIKKRCSPYKKIKKAGMLPKNIPDENAYFTDNTQTKLYQIDSWKFPNYYNPKNPYVLSDKFYEYVKQNGINKRAYNTKEITSGLQDATGTIGEKICSDISGHKFFTDYTDLTDYNIMPNVYESSIISQQKNYSFADYDTILDKTDFKNCKNGNVIDENDLEAINLNKIYQLKIILLSNIQQEILNKLYSLFKDLVDYSDDNQPFENFYQNQTELDKIYETLFKDIIINKDNKDSLSTIINTFFQVNSDGDNEFKYEKFTNFFEDFKIGITRAEELYLELLQDTTFLNAKDEAYYIEKLYTTCSGEAQYLNKRKVLKNNSDKLTGKELLKNYKTKTEFVKYAKPNDSSSTSPSK
jgi:hypothetical protein